DEIDRLIREAEDFADSDRVAKDVLMLKTKLESLLRNTKKSFTEYGGLLSETDQGNAESVFKEADAAAVSDKLDEIKTVMNKLERVAGQLTTAMLNPGATASEV